MTNYKYTIEFRLRHPERIKAHRKVFTGVRNGTIIRKPCKVCNSKKSEAHHKNYSQPLKIVWLCKKHHVEEHNRIGWARIEAK